MWPPSFELHTGPVACSDHDQRPDTRPIEAPSRRKSENHLAKLGASTHGADFSCPISTSIFARIAAEAALDEMEMGKPAQDVTPFWRTIEPDGPVARRLSCGPEFIAVQRAAKAGSSS
jgi:hypothetical protein